MTTVSSLPEHHASEENPAQASNPAAGSDNTLACEIPPSDFEGEPRIFCQLKVNRNFICDQAISGFWGL